MIKSRKTNKIFAILLAFVMVLGMIPAIATTAQAATNHFVRITESPYGKLEFVDYDGVSTQVAEGTEITIKAIPDDGYVFTQWRVGTGAYTKVEAGTTEFVYTVPTGLSFMQTYKIEGMFQPVLGDGEYYVTSVLPANITFEGIPEKAKAGDEITFSGAHKENDWWYLKSVKVTPEDTSIEAYELTPQTFVGQETSWKFTMPACNVTVSGTTGE